MKEPRPIQIYGEMKTPQAGLANDFVKEFNSTPSINMESTILKIAIKFDRNVCQFAIERKTKKVFTFKKTHFDNNHYIVDYNFFDETEEDTAREFAKSAHAEFEIVDFSRILEMLDEEFERIVGSMYNADIARKYRQVMKDYE